MKLKILYINDLHSRFEEFARIASAIEDLREENMLIFDAGDFHDPWRIEAIGTNGKISSDLLNEVCFNARVVGNTEGFSGKETLENMVKTSNFPIITCNMYDLKGEKFKISFLYGMCIPLVVGAFAAMPEEPVTLTFRSLFLLFLAGVGLQGIVNKGNSMRIKAKL